MSNSIIEKLTAEGYIPRDKGWMIRMSFLDLTNGYGPNDTIDFLKTQDDLSEDEKAALAVATTWNAHGPIDVMESRTMYILVQFYLWKVEQYRKILTRGTLTKRINELEASCHIIRWPLQKLLTLEKGTTQWASAAILTGNKDVLPELPFYIQKTYQALEHWNLRRKLNICWVPQTDPTITTQVNEYICYVKTGNILTTPNHLGDCDLYCFLRAFGAITQNEGKRIWPQLQKHESNRIVVMEIALKEFYAGIPVSSNDHRIVQAIAMVAQSIKPKTSIEEIKRKFKNPNCVNKAWPQFWDFLEIAPSLWR